MKRTSILCMIFSIIALMFVPSATLPADAYKECSYCWGTGKQQQNQYFCCTSCSGKGCMDCYNSGYKLIVTNIECPSCQGTGKWGEYFNVTYYANDGTDNVIKSRQSEIEPLIISECSFIRPNLVFKGWATTQNGEVMYQPGDSCTITSDIAFYAIWKADDNNAAVTSKEMCHNCNGQGYFKKEKNCTTCNGTHYIDTESECTKSSGTGVIMTTSYQKCTRCYGGNVGIIDPNCYICNGTGYLYTNLGQTCTKCSGRGKISDTRICSNCYEGKIYTEIKCDSCSGLGYIEITELTVKGDINQYNQLSIADAIILQKYILGSIELSETESESADICRDGCVNIFDMVAMRRLLINSMK